MWLPTTLYEKAPHYWLLLGLLLVVIGIYLGMEVGRFYLFLGVGSGVVSCAWSIRTYWQRSLNRERSAEAAEQA